MGVLFPSKSDRRCACGANLYQTSQDTGGSKMDKHRNKTGCSSPGRHTTLFGSHCVVCGKGV